MIYEYAVDPNVLRHWQDFRHIADGLGFGRGRVLVRYPPHWTRLAHEAVDNLDDNTKKKVVTWLADRSKYIMTTARAGAQPYIFSTWFENAVAEHARMRFHALIAEQNASENPPVLRSSEIDDSKPLWAVETQHFIPRSVAEVVKLAAPLLAHATAIRFIDPYFKGDPDQVAILVGSLAQCVNAGRTSVVSVELHVDGKQVQPPTENFIANALGNQWPAGLPQIKVIRWKQEHLHNRFILTDRGGIMFGDSLRQHPTRPDQMTLMGDVVRTNWWQYHDPRAHPAKVCRPGEVI